MDSSLQNGHPIGEYSQVLFRRDSEQGAARARAAFAAAIRPEMAAKNTTPRRGHDEKLISARVGCAIPVSIC
jgi:hypothetical protein